MSGKRKRVVLTIKDKLDIIKKLEDGGSSKQLAGVYGIGETTVRDIRKNKEKIITYASSSDSTSLLAKRKSMKPSMYEELDRAMLEWFNQQRARGNPVSGPLCAKRAEFFFYALGMDGDFNPSAGWLTRFKQRHSIREIGVRMRESLRARGLPEKAVLLLDNSPTHPNENVLRSDDGQIFAKYLPPSVAALIQPSDQGVVAALKRNYRVGLLRNNLEEGNDLRAFWKRLTLLDALYEVAAAWSLVRPGTISRAWRKILPVPEEKEGLDPDQEDVSVATVAALLQHTKGLEHVTTEGVEKWLEVDSSEPGYEVLTDSEIIRRAQGQTDESSGDEDEEVELIPERHLNHAAALRWTENLLDYLEQQGDMILPDKLVIRKLRATIRNKQKMTNSSQ
ncbi:jerky protein homolog-like [Carlito syrichta]|uniref:Jerky protein homolog-like n=1 Tax=Carlito syrichta TaxID=1868482 RepID=A0A1U7SLB7_CARSF|nr:jerky protein homolog-like [Carlito syrichta]